MYIEDGSRGLIETTDFNQQKLDNGRGFFGKNGTKDELTDEPRHDQSQGEFFQLAISKNSETQVAEFM